MSTSPLKILMVSTEAVPFAKTGGLADVAGTLPRELARLGNEVRLVIPRYGAAACGADRFEGFQEWARLAVPTPAGAVTATIERGYLGDRIPGNAVPLYAVRHDPFFDRRGLYQEAGVDYPDNLDRFAFFCRAIMDLMAALAREGWTPDLLHAHDWQTSLCSVYRRALYARHLAFRDLRCLLTIHNLGYQGLFPASEYPKIGLPSDMFTPAGLEFYGSLNLLKGGLIYSDFLTTVSPTYSREIQTPQLGFGLEGVIAERRDRLAGVVNGIDVEVWNPSTDPHLPARYSASDLSGKGVCKAGLQREMKLPVRNVPLLGIVSRLTAQKGLDLIAAIMPDLMALDLQLVLLGTGDPSDEAHFRSFCVRFPDKFGLRIGFDDGLAHRIQAGADILLMPSRYEPCGLSQLYSLRYGTVPLVRRTGGLADTVVAYGPQTIRDHRATGFVFEETTPQALLNMILLALRVYEDRGEWLTLIQAGMLTDVSWARSARLYDDVYRRVLKQPV
jgi:starch synthase